MPARHNRNDDLLIGLDFGSDSVRAVAVASDGRELTTSVHPYRRWSDGLYTDASLSQYRQHPLDYLEGTEAVIRDVLKRIDPSRVKGIGVDTTASTPCAVDREGVPLSLTPGFEEDPDAMFVLWKDHTAQQEADEINAAVRKSPVDYTKYEGGVYSPEWFWAKYLHILRHNEAVRGKCCTFVEHCDWITAELAGTSVKAGRCTAGHKAMWHPDWNGLPPEDFLVSVDPLLKGRRARLYADTYTADVPVGHLSEKWAEKLGLSTDVIIAGGMIDCHSGAVGSGIRPGQLLKVIGTSTCDILTAQKLDRCIPGICGQVDGSVVPGLTGLEAGQSAFGDIYAWFKRFLSYGGEVTLSQLEKDAAGVAPGTAIALDWMNGRRTPYSNQKLKGAVFGLTLGTTPPMVYRALIESTAFGAKRIADHFIEQGIKVDQILATGGIAKKSQLVMQICADVLGCPIGVVASEQTCALGAAIFAAAAAGLYADVPMAMKYMASPVEKVFTPDPAQSRQYGPLYKRYLELADCMETLP